MVRTPVASISFVILSALLAACAPLLGTPAAPTYSSPLGASLNELFDDPALAHAHWGVHIRSLENGEIIYARNEQRLFTPASNTKLLTAAAALETLGPDFRYRTTLMAGGQIRNGVLEGPLVVVGSGDPTFSGRFLEDPRDAFRVWADSLRAHGITRIAGGVIGVDTAFADPPLGAGWAWDDLMSAYAAEFGALMFNEGAIELDLFPSRTTLEPAIVVLTPPTQAVRIINDTRTMPAGSNTALRVLPDELGTGIVLRGEVAEDTEALTRTVAVRNPALYFASVVREALREQGITVEGPAVRHTALELHDPTLQNAFTIFTHSSPPLREILPAMMKPSQNQMAEVLLRTIGREVRREATAAGGAAVVDSLLRAWDAEDLRYRLADGSGLSRYNLLAPRLITSLLVRMADSPHRDIWLESLPVAGRDGTLASRMRDEPLYDRVRAKTGTVSNVRALSGYLTTRSGERIVFSTIVNGHMLSAGDVDRIVESALALIAESR